ncbi:tRNA pseudouridine(55) synthase TruB [Natranaerofaba carboxydovora]|uniref:tRNA pseudouridine(55) synthase TruB n=1 Tax=Natranaerofaba carboxydovora TaxID=2742683 RepID=UPI001F140F25|nr:tRNA pseudouridine(55) synthase TruB [Natranaerofaba carboxydovora]UMZ73413.1 tRNA pseudouridine synthase B [Natranaerofaba carboxydovora]
MKGILNLLKPPGSTSHDMVDQVRKKLQIKKIGHTGTLDPGACGVLPLIIGKATKISDYIISQDKEYIFELTLGVSTDTLDGEGNILEEVPVTEKNEKQLLDGYQKLIGSMKQVPPMYSAIKRGGKKLYELARNGETVNREPRDVSIYDLQLKHTYLHKNKKRFLFKVNCSKGTYIRVLAEDLAKIAGTIGYMSFLLRTKAGNFTIDNAIRYEEFIDARDEDLYNYIVTMDKALVEFPRVKLNEKKSRFFRSGNAVDISIPDTIEPSLYRIYDENEEFLGLGREISHGKLKPEKVLV